MNPSPYAQFAQRLNELPNGFPPTEEGYELQILEHLFTPEEATLSAQLRLTLESAREISDRTGWDYQDARQLLKGMAMKGLIRAGGIEGGIGYGLMPFVVGIYEAQLGQIDHEMAELFEKYYRKVFVTELSTAPQVHRVIPIGESVQGGIAIEPYESVTALVEKAQSWGVIDCICRKQKAEIGDPCGHPVDVCLIFSQRPNAYDGHPVIQTLTKDGAYGVLKRASNAGLVHSVSNNQQGITYICNCCTCSCGILRGLKEMGFANVVARSAFVITVAAEICSGCEDCLPYCQFDSLKMGDDLVMQVNALRCVGCGACVIHCSTGAMTLVRRPEEDILPIPVTNFDWMAERAAAKGIELQKVL